MPFGNGYEILFLDIFSVKVIVCFFFKYNEYNENNPVGPPESFSERRRTAKQINRIIFFSEQ